MGAAVAGALGGAVASAQAAPPITEFSQGVGSDPSSLTVGPDGNLWFVDQGSIGRITLSGQVTEFSQGLLMGSRPTDIESGPGGDLWFSDTGTTPAIGRITPTGQITETAAGTGGLLATAHPGEMTEGPNGTIFFFDNGSPNEIGEINAQGTISEVPTGAGVGPTLNDLTAGPDGNIYFVFSGTPSGFGKLDVAAGTISTTPTANSTIPGEIVTGPDGNLWAGDEGDDQIFRLGLASGVATPFGNANGLQPMGDPDGGITAGADGNVWFSDQFSGNFEIGRITPAGAISEFPINGTPLDITTGIDGNVWVPQPDGVTRVSQSGTVTKISAGLNPGAEFMDGTNIISGPDGNLWAVDEGSPKAIARIDVQLPPTATTGAASAVSTSTATIAGTANPRGNAASVAVDFGTTSALGTKVAAATLPISDQVSNVSATLPGLAAGTTYDYRVEATNAYGTAVGAIQSFTTAPAPATTTIAATRTRTAHVGNQLVTLVTPSPKACVAGSSAFSVTLNSATVAGSHAATLHFRSAAFFLDRGIRHAKTIHRHVHGKLKKVKVVRFTANAIAHDVPATESLRFTTLTGKTHSLKVVIRYTRTVKRHGHRKTAAVTRTLRSSLKIC